MTANEERVDIPAFSNCAFSLDEEKRVCFFFLQHGVVVVEDVFTKDACAHTLKELHQVCLQSGGGNGKWRARHPDSWSPYPLDGLEKYGIIPSLPIFTPQVLKNRQNSNLHQVCASLLGTNRLLVSHDRLGFLRPTRKKSLSSALPCFTKFYSRTHTNLHLDMNPWVYQSPRWNWRKMVDKVKYRVEGPQCFLEENNIMTHQSGPRGGVALQAVINLLPNENAKDGGLIVVPNFQGRRFSKWTARNKNSSYFRTPDIDGLSIDPDDPLWKEARRIPMKMGSVAVWDQRLPHGTMANDSFHPRAAQFVRMFPSNWLTLSQRNERRKVLQSLFPSSFIPSSTGRIVFDF